MIRRLLIANRGEIAIRIARGARELGISPVGIYSDADERALFRGALDASLRIGPAPAETSYLDGAAIVAAARTLGADAVHPGYGFLSERAPFAQSVIDAGLRFVGPTPAAIAASGSKIEAKRRARAAGVPVIPGDNEADRNDKGALHRAAVSIGVPLVIKASAGGGGHGLRVVEDLRDFDEALAAARREARAAFGDETILLERLLPRARHVEFQILADDAGHVVHLGERECSIQRRHQKILEEAPSVALTPALRAQMGAAAVAVAHAVGYTNAGTVEFLLADDGSFAFLEVNARLQVEHAPTELVYGVDLVHEQLRIAAGEPLRFTQDELIPRGWAIEARLNAEDPARAYAPQTGTLTAFTLPSGPGIRVDAGVESGSMVTPFYDALLAKIVVWAEDRPAAIARLEQALATTHVAGIATNLPLLRAIIADPAFRAGTTSTRFLDERAAALTGALAGRADDAALLATAALVASGAAWRTGGVGVPIALECEGARWAARAERTHDGWHLHGDLDAALRIVSRTPLAITTGGRSLGGAVSVGERGVEVSLDGRDYVFTFPAPPGAAAARRGSAAGSGTLTAPMPGRVAGVFCVPGRRVAAQELLVVLEAMKMEHRIEAPLAGTVATVHVAPGDVVAAGATLVTVA